jgi:hypothetical protein
MKKKVFLLFLFGLMQPSFAEAGQCELQRMYKDNAQVVQYLSIQRLEAEGAKSSDSCVRACRQQGQTISALDAGVVKGKAATQATVRCAFTDAKVNGGQPKVVGESTLPLSRFKVASAPAMPPTRKLNPDAPLPPLPDMKSKYISPTFEAPPPPNPSAENGGTATSATPPVSTQPIPATSSSVWRPNANPHSSRENTSYGNGTYDIQRRLPVGVRSREY